jgi:hypothetical protein
VRPTIILFLILSSISVSQALGQEFTLTTTAANTVASKATIEMPGLAGNPGAIIVATPSGNTATLNPHPIGAWYYNGKWNIFNTDHANMAVGLKFKVEVFLGPAAGQFVHTVTKENLSDGVSIVDNLELNGIPTAQIKIFQNHAPDYRTSYLNKSEAMAEYDNAAGKWLIKNVNGQRLFPGTTYNVVVTSGRTSRSDIPTQSSGTQISVVSGVPVNATTMMPSPGPVTVVAREQNFVIPPTNLALSPGTCRFMALYTNPNVVATDTVIVTGLAYDNGMFLVWSAAVDNGSVQISVCNSKPSNSGVSGALNLSYGRKVNILVLR